MNSPTCITRSEPRANARPFALLALAALLAGCAGNAPDPQRPIDPSLPMAHPGPEPEKGQGNLSFHYANRSTAADLAIDLSSTDVYLEMSGKAALEQAGRMGARDAAPRPGAPARDPAPAPEPGEAPDDPGAPQGGKQEAKPAPSDLPRAGKGLHKGPPKRPEPPPPEEEPEGDYEDVTAKVLAGIRRAQELFYQKRYPEAMQAVRSSLDARATAEGHALLGSIHFMQGQTGMARRQWMEALRLNPDMPSVVNMLEKTRTPGGRGSPSPRPVMRPPAPAPAPGTEAPYPEEYSSPEPDAAPVRAPADAVPARSRAPLRGTPPVSEPAQEPAPEAVPAAGSGGDPEPVPAPAPFPASAPVPARAAAPAPAAPSGTVPTAGTTSPAASPKAPAPAPSVPEAGPSQPAGAPVPSGPPGKSAPPAETSRPAPEGAARKGGR